MGKYEVKITRSSHVRSMVAAVAISLVVGVGVGYILGLTMPISLNQKVVKSDVTQTQKPTEKPIVKQPAQSNNTLKDEQNGYVKGVLNTFYKINLATYNRIKSESLSESKTKKVSKDSIFKDKLIKEYQGILAKGQLQTMTDFISKGRLDSSYYLDYFNNQESSSVSLVENIEYKNNIINAKVCVTNPFEYGGTYGIPSSQTFFGELKGKGISSAQYEKFLGSKPSKLNLTENKEVTLIIENINGKWMITSMNDALISSQINDATINGKKVTFADILQI